VERNWRDYRQRKPQNKEDHLLVVRAEAKDIAVKAINSAQDEELKGILSELLTKEYYANKNLYRKHRQMYKE
jgi:hypothetical protein